MTAPLIWASRMTSPSNMADLLPLSTNHHPPHDVTIQHGRLFTLSLPITTHALKRGHLVPNKLALLLARFKLLPDKLHETLPSVTPP